MAEAFAAVQPLLDEYDEIERQLSDPAVHADAGRARTLGRRFAELGRVVAAHRAWEAAQDDLAAARDMADADPEFAAEIPALEAAAEEATETLRRILIPRDPDDARDVILEIKSGEGGEESALFAGDLLKMYLKYAETKGWKAEVLEATETDMGGFKDISVALKSKGNPEPQDGVWAQLKYEGGVHRVQRVPATESQGRIHTSAAGVLVYPEAEEVEELEIDMNDVRVDVYRSSGPGGQSVNTTDSAVRLTHVPTGIVVSCQNEKSQLQNKESALRILRARLLAAQKEAAEAEAHDIRKSQVRTVDRSERIRTYNYPENRIADHRTGYKAYNLDHVLGGRPRPGDPVRDRRRRGGAARRVRGRSGARWANGCARRPGRSRRRGCRRQSTTPASSPHSCLGEPRYPVLEPAELPDGFDDEFDARGRAPRRPGAAATHPGVRGVSLRDARGRPRRVRAASRDGGGRGRRDRRGREARRRGRTRRSSSTCARDPARSPRRSTSRSRPRPWSPWTPRPMPCA